MKILEFFKQSLHGANIFSVIKFYSSCAKDLASRAGQNWSDNVETHRRSNCFFIPAGLSSLTEPASRRSSHAAVALP